jgi:hypothetical protein
MEHDVAIHHGRADSRSFQSASNSSAYEFENGFIKMSGHKLSGPKRPKTPFCALNTRGRSQHSQFNDARELLSTGEDICKLISEFE